MITVVEPKKNIIELLGEHLVRKDAVYRMMRYVIRVDHDNKVLLHNAVTGQLIVLDAEEAEELDSLPNRYTPHLETLVRLFFVVPESFNEHGYVSGMRNVLRKIADARQGPEITFYTILPTTACNARCYYCFEKGIDFATMTEKTANDVVRFITTHCCGNKVWLKWFGGEPTVAANRISQICSGLTNQGVSFDSIMTTNGYLFDKEMALEAKKVWNLKQVTLSMDGVGQNYNRIKNYVGTCGDPYERVISNIGLLAEQGIRVNVRMNFDQTNVTDFEKLLSEIYRRYHPSSLIAVRAHFINDIQIVDGVERHHGSEDWYNNKLLELNQLSHSMGFLNENYHLPCLSYSWCPAASLRSVTITPQGKLVSCYELLDDSEAKGDVTEGIVNKGIVNSWLKYADEVKCSECMLFPYCAKVYKCPRMHICYHKTEFLFKFQKCMVDTYRSFISNQCKEV